MTHQAAIGQSSRLRVPRPQGALIQAIPLRMMGGVSIVVFGLIAIAGAKIWFDNQADFSDNKHLLVAAIPLIVRTSDQTLKFGDFAFGGIALCASPNRRG